jgi:integrase
MVKKVIVVMVLAMFVTGSIFAQQEAANIKKKPLSLAYIKNNERSIRLHIAPYKPFKKIKLSELTSGAIRDWQAWANAQGAGPRCLNIALQAMKVPISYAVKRQELDRNPFDGVDKAADRPSEKGILSQAEAGKLIVSECADTRRRLAVLLALCCGMRRGEVRGLHWEDIGGGILDIRHNYIDGEGLKAPKWSSTRQVPIPQAVQKLLDTVRSQSRHAGGLIFESGRNDIPLSANYFERAIAAELAAIGIPGKWKGKGDAPQGYANEQKRRNLSYHSLRHSFITLTKAAGISDMAVMAMAGHTNERTSAHYTHGAQILNFEAERARLEAAFCE